MRIIPAIDLLGGSCVRLYQGRYDSARRYPASPAETARSFASAGASRIHIVDLDAARGEGSHNRPAIAAIRQAVSCSLQVGGGIRAEDDVAALLALGAERLILGTVLIHRPEQVARWVQEYGTVFWASIDALEGRVRVSGWEEASGLEDLEVARRAKNLGLRGIVYTNIARDGTLAGPDLERSVRVAEEAGLPLILSGGIGSEAHVEAAYRLKHPLIRAVIVGKALYEGRVDLARLIRTYGDEPEY